MRHLLNVLAWLVITSGLSVSDVTTRAEVESLAESFRVEVPSGAFVETDQGVVTGISKGAPHVQAPFDPAAVDILVKLLDSNQDGVVSAEEAAALEQKLREAESNLEKLQEVEQANARLQRDQVASSASAPLEPLDREQTEVHTDMGLLEQTEWEEPPVGGSEPPTGEPSTGEPSKWPEGDVAKAIREKEKETGDALVELQTQSEAMGRAFAEMDGKDQPLVQRVANPNFAEGSHGNVGGDSHRYTARTHNMEDVEGLSQALGEQHKLVQAYEKVLGKTKSSLDTFKAKLDAENGSRACGAENGKCTTYMVSNSCSFPIFGKAWTAGKARSALDGQCPGARSKCC